MSSITNPATGGKIWAPREHATSTHQKAPQKPRKKTKTVLTRLAILLLILGSSILVSCLGIAGLAGGIAPVKTIQRTDGVLILQYSTLQTDEVITEIKDWAPEALKVNPTNVNQVNLDNFDEGATGSIQLTDGNNIPFTLHNYQTGTFTVEKG